MSLQETLYRLALRALRRISPVLSGGESKLAAGLRGRRTASAALVEWGREERDPLRPVVWFHAPSVGEGFQARAVARVLRQSRPDVQVVYTYFSPSAVLFAREMPADFRGFLPWDLPDEIVPAVDAVRPDAIVYTKTEVWPVLTREADRRNIPSLLVAATLPENAGRASPPGRWLLGSTFARLSAVAAIAEEDAGRFSFLGVSRDRVRVTGDPGIDSAAERLGEADRRAPYLAPFRGWSSGLRGASGPGAAEPGASAVGASAVGSPAGGDGAYTLVAGSTWASDEDVLLPALARARRSIPDLRLVIAPHEPTDDHVSGLVRRLEEDRWRVALLGEVEERGMAEGHDAVVVDRVGVLAHLYTLGVVAYVGGGFHDQGLHSVLEPAAAGVPVLFGPGHGNARAARDLLRAGGATEVGSAEGLTQALIEWSEDRDAARQAGKRARGYIRSHQGAARRTVELLEAFLDESAGFSGRS